MRNACAKAKEAAPDLAIDGELQFDAAVSPRVAETNARIQKLPDMLTHLSSQTSTLVTSVTNRSASWWIRCLRSDPSWSECTDQRSV